MKTCFKCGETKAFDGFYKHAAMRDGYLNKCKECTKADVIKNRAENVEKYREYDRIRATRPDRIANALEQSRKWRAEDRRRGQCHNAVARALKRGDLVPENCKCCGSEKSLAHHESYDRPLDVVWYCQPCHKARHKEMKALGIVP